MHVFADLTDFVNQVNPLNPNKAEYPNIVAVLDGYFNISRGCSCTRKHRSNLADNSYKSLGEKMIDSEKMWFKTTFVSNEIVGKFGEVECWKI